MVIFKVKREALICREHGSARLGCAPSSALSASPRLLVWDHLFHFHPKPGVQTPAGGAAAWLSWELRAPAAWAEAAWAGQRLPSPAAGSPAPAGSPSTCNTPRVVPAPRARGCLLPFPAARGSPAGGRVYIASLRSGSAQPRAAFGRKARKEPAAARSFAEAGSAACRRCSGESWPIPRDAELLPETPQPQPSVQAVVQGIAAHPLAGSRRWDVAAMGGWGWRAERIPLGWLMPRT